MALGRAYSVAVRGVDGAIVEIEADIMSGLPGVHLVGLPDAALQEARDRVRAAITNCGNSWPMARLTLALSPATLPKMGSVYDIALALAVLSAHLEKSWAQLDKAVLLGELALDGRVRPVKGVLPAVLAAKREGWPHGHADRRHRLRSGLRFGSRLQLDRGPQLSHRGHRRQLGVMLVGTVGGPLGDDPNLILRQLALPHRGRTAGELIESTGDCDDGLRGAGWWLSDEQREHFLADGLVEQIGEPSTEGVRPAPANRPPLLTDYKSIPADVPIAEPEEEPLRSIYRHRTHAVLLDLATDLDAEAADPEAADGATGAGELLGGSAEVLPESAVSECLAALDRLDLPASSGAPTAREALRAAGQRFGNEVIAAAVRARKASHTLSGTAANGSQ